MSDHTIKVTGFCLCFSRGVPLWSQRPSIRGGMSALGPRIGASWLVQGQQVAPFLDPATDLWLTSAVDRTPQPTAPDPALCVSAHASSLSCVPPKVPCPGTPLFTVESEVSEADGLKRSKLSCLSLSFFPALCRVLSGREPWSVVSACCLSSCGA